MRDFDHACFRALAAEPRAVGCSAVRRFGPREQTGEAKVDHGASDQALTRHITWIAASFGGWSANPSPFFMAPACAGRAVTESRSSAGLRIVSGVYRVAAGTLQPKQHRVRVSRTAPSISICPSCQGAPLVARDELVGSEDGDGAGET